MKADLNTQSRPTTSGAGYSTSTPTMQQTQYSQESRTEILTFQKNDLVYMPGSVADKVYFIEKGRVKLGNYDSEGKEVITTVLFEGQIFGEECLISDGPRADYAKSMGELEVKAIPLEDFSRSLQSNGTYALDVTKLVLRKLVSSKKKWYSKMTNLARPRIISFLIDLAKENGQRLGYEILVNKFFTHHELACLTGTARQTVSSVLNELKKKNIIYFDRKKIIYRDLDLLVAELNNNEE